VYEGAIGLYLAEELLTAMQARARPVVPKRLGVLGEAHLGEALTAWDAVDPATLVYRAQKGTPARPPSVLELACGQRADADAGRELLCGFNFTPALGVPFQALPWACGTADVNEDDPVALVVHVTCPWLDTTDRGKTAVTLPDEVKEAMRTLVAKVAEPW